MEFLIVSKAPIITDIPKVSPQQRSPYATSHKTSPKRHKPKPRISLSLDTLTTECPKCDTSISELTNQIKRKKPRKARNSSSVPRCDHVNTSPQKVTKATHSVAPLPHRSAPVLSRSDLSPYKLCPKTTYQPLTLSPDKIIKRAISNIMCRSATYSNPATSNAAKGMFTPNRPPKSSPYRPINPGYPLVPYGTKQGHNMGHRNVPHKKRIYLSEPHNPGVSGSTAGRIPPLNSPIEVSRSIEFVPSLGDARSQVCLQKELRALESKRLAISLANSERERAQNERRICEEKLRAKSQFRAEIYSLNGVMRELEANKFNESLSAKV